MFFFILAFFLSRASSSASDCDPSDIQCRVEEHIAQRRMMAPKSQPSETELSKDYYDSKVHYHILFGDGNIHFGLYEQSIMDIDQSKFESTISSFSYEKLKEIFVHGGTELTRVMLNEAAQVKNGLPVTDKSRVLDLGCGYGKALMDIHDWTQCQAIGLDYTKMHVDYANEQVLIGRRVGISFVEGTMLDLSGDLKQHGFTHVFSQAAICHVQNHLKKVLTEAKEALAPNGLLVINDMTSNVQGDETFEYVWKRMNFAVLVSHADYLAALDEAGFHVEYQKEFNGHFWRSYKILEVQARRIAVDPRGDLIDMAAQTVRTKFPGHPKWADHMFLREVFTRLADSYRGTCEAIRQEMYGMNIIVASVKK